jgi:molecular chaperone DnaK
MEIGDGVFEVKSTNGDARLGGDEFDSAIAQWLAAEFKKDTGIDLGQDLMAYQRLREAAEKAKIELSAMQVTEINLPYIASGQDGPKHLQKPLTREMFAQMIKKHLESIGSLCAEALKEAGVTAEQIDEVILVGASSRIPAVKQAVKDVFNKEPVKGVNTDEAVAEGAAIQGGILSGDIKDVLLMDATTFSYGIETSGGFMKKMLKRNTTTPSRNSHIFTTAADNQTLVTIQVLEGEKEKAAQNLVLGRFDLSGISPAPRGTAQIEVTFDIDANKTIHVTAKDLRAGKEQRICIENPSGLSYQEIDQKAGIAMVGGTDESGEAEKKYRESKMALLESGYDKAVPLLKEAADKGHAGAQYELADCYYNGKGVTQDYAKAAEWYKKAADQGNADARNTLGVCYYQGKGVKQDYSKAVECFQIAANQGYSSSVLNLGSCYHYGNGVQKDYTKALELYQKAADSGNETAKKALNDLKDKIANPVCAKCGAKIDQGSKFCDKCGAPV